MTAGLSTFCNAGHDEAIRLDWVLAALVLLVALALPHSARANDLNLEPVPDLFAVSITINYNAAADTFSANGGAFQLTTGSGTELIAGTWPPPMGMIGEFDLDASIDDTGTFLSGTLDISGTIANLGFNSGTLLTGTLTSFSSGGTTDPFEFLFNVTGGDAAGLYGSTGGIIMTSGGGNYDGMFDMNFTQLSALADVGVPTVSEPGILGLLALGTMVAIRRRRPNSQGEGALIVS